MSTKHTHTRCMSKHIYNDRHALTARTLARAHKRALIHKSHSQTHIISGWLIYPLVPHILTSLSLLWILIDVTTDLVRNSSGHAEAFWLRGSAPLTETLPIFLHLHFHVWGARVQHEVRHWVWFTLHLIGKLLNRNVLLHHLQPREH